MRKLTREEFQKMVKPEEMPEIKRLALLMTTASQAEITEVAVMPGGLTNRNFKVTLGNGRQVAVRIAGEGTAEYMNRSAEKFNLTLMGTLGIAPEIYFYDARTGSQLSEFIVADTMHPENFQTDRVLLEKSAKLMSTYHNSGLRFASDFDPLREIQNYAGLLRNCGFTEVYEDVFELREPLFQIRDAYVYNPPPKVPCHNDPLSENFMYDGEKLTLIDREYAGMNDRYCDLAAVIDENHLDAETERFFLDAYFGAALTEEQLARVYINKFIMEALWCVWSLVQIQAGKDHNLYWNYGLERLQHCRELLADDRFARYLELIK